MIEGVVNAAYEPVVVLVVQGPSGQASEIEAIIDTGFTGFLTVTPALATELGLALEGTSRATLADGSEVTFDVYDVAVLWDGQPKYVLADAADTTPPFYGPILTYCLDQFWGQVTPDFSFLHSACASSLHDLRRVYNVDLPAAVVN